jgi:pimeloyl-ACP methyl ester carboxylesterase
LQRWGAAPELVAAGACHAAYGTQGFPIALVARSERAWLRARIGDHAEGIVYAYCASDRTEPLNDAHRDRFTGEWQHQPGWLRRALTELTAANELDVAEHVDSAEAKRAIGQWLVSLVAWLSPAARAAVQSAPCCHGLTFGTAAADGGDADIAYRDLGAQGAKVVLWHGGAPPELTWSGQRALGSALALRIPWRRDFPPSAPAERRDFEVDARDLLRIMPGSCHVVAHSIGALSALVAAACAPERFASLVLIEPPVAWLLPDDPEVQRLVALARGDLHGDPSARSAFLAIAASPLDHPETKYIERSASKLRDPSEAAPRLDELCRADVPAAIISGQHEPGIERQCDALAARLGAQRWRLPNAGHAVQRHPDFNSRLLAFLEPPRASSQ